MTWKAGRPKRRLPYISRYSIIASVATATGVTQYLTPDNHGYIHAHVDVWVRDENGQTVQVIPEKRFKLYADSDASGLLDLREELLTVGGSNHFSPDFRHSIYLHRFTFRHRPYASPSPPGLKAIQYVLMVEPPLWSPKSSVAAGCAIISVPVYMF
nr:hypothetical protein [uncultured Cupriavidus sp.]